MRLRLKTFANLIIVITGLTVLGVVVSGFTRKQLPGTFVQDYKPGEKVGVVPVDFSKSPQTLVFVLNSQCHFCAESVPFYQALLNNSNARQSTRMVIVGREEMPKLREYTKQHQMMFDDVVSLGVATFKSRGTPTLVLLDRSGTVKAVWSGRLSDKGQQEVVTSLTNGHL